MTQTKALSQTLTKRRFWIASAFFLIGVTGFAFSAFSQDLTPERQKALETIIHSYLKAAGPNLKQDGELLVTPNASETYYEATLPALSAKDSKTGKGVDLGTPKLNARPLENGEWKTTLALPQEITATQNGQSIFTLAVGRQKFDGILVEGANAFTVINATYSNVTLTDLKHDNTTTIGLFTIAQEGEAKNNRITGPVTLGADTLTLMANGNSPLALERVTLEGTVQDIDALMQRFVVRKDGEAPANVSNKKVKLTIYGLDKAASAVRLTGAVPTPDEQKVLATMAVLQIAGQKQEDGDIRTYNLEITPDGKFLVNGTDLSSLL
ncbi:MAG: hypothetical protein AB7E85_03325 [Pseudobdellovibrionaceae bacterium]